MNYNLYPLQENQLLATNAHIGMRLKQRRKELKLTQLSLAQAINISYQQIQKYEKGSNRIGADRLYYLAVLLGVDISYFFLKLNEHSIVTPSTPRADNGNIEISEINPAIRIALVNLIDVMNHSPTIEPIIDNIKN
ncbi:MAG: helix-turn-helix transcriptional regulator [Sphingomonadales bacterium]|nr:helix-turn-helix transcriptional regulator [Sphingomonadales bacterium]